MAAKLSTLSPTNSSINGIEEAELEASGESNMSLTSTQKIEILRATTPAQIDEVRTLFLEYAQSLGFSLCFQGFDQELAQLPGVYSPPKGRLLLATVDGQSAGCCGLRGLEDNTCEMKRLYVQPQFRRLGLGRRLAEQIVAEAVILGYERMRLDTIVGKMDEAIRLYRQLGFNEIPPYRPNRLPGVLFMELELRQT